MPQQQQQQRSTLQKKMTLEWVDNNGWRRRAGQQEVYLVSSACIETDIVKLFVAECVPRARQDCAHGMLQRVYISTPTTT
jgi:hypothetical protein